MSRRVAINLVFFLAVFGLLLGWAVRNIVVLDQLERPYELTAEFTATGGVRPNAEVAYLGVNIGRVGSVELIEDGVRIQMKIDADDPRIPVGSLARIFRKSAIGEPYIDFQPPPGFDPEAPGAEFYDDGDSIPIEMTTTPLEFSELLRSASALLSNVDPDDVQIVIHELAIALDGRAEDLRQITLASDQLAATFAARTDVLDRLATNNTRLTRVFADHRDSFGQSIADLRAVASSLRNASGDLATLLDDGTRLLAETGDLLADVRPDLDCILGNLVDVNAAGTTADRLRGLAHLLDAGPTAFGLFFTTRDIEPDGLWVRVNLLAATENPADQYVPPRDLPAVPAIPACAGARSVTDTGVPRTNFDPGSVSGGSLPATGTALAGTVAAVLLAAGLAARLLLRAPDARR